MCCRLTTKVDYKFTEFSLWIADYIEDRSLLNIPENYWKQFTLLVYFHFILGGFLFLFRGYFSLSEMKKYILLI
uniref:Uncharacterized protein n=1 Tax=Heterorhabditis bacteriophora TaxID=37862 RepID=A0A1I7WNW7_HETBA